MASLPFCKASEELVKKGWKLAELPNDVIGDNDMIDPVTRYKCDWQEAVAIQKLRDDCEKTLVNAILELCK